ncbi:thermonuclease family protein [Thermosipho atlanticus]|uniref:Endonuclease YncB, thermonuclease family n=1 Tax=Thermosipho atlanticus DSM 15807 TaxID=1123380 RepID=A0A1M5U169_9BACT|nr:thermonuclease family protein [Thermosipho atlanticus]SHH56772.1 Endonuclease YncB, thermonuclease family [Thermosipho atlanticus DSM 15807]
MNIKNYFALTLFSLLLLISSCVNLTSFEVVDVINVNNLSQTLEHVTVVSVVDGDTFKILESSNSVRIIGIDTPEIHEGSKPIGEFGEDAKNYLENFVSKYDIYILKMGYDNYGRILAYVFGKVDEQNYAFYESSILKAGLARPLIYFDNDDPYLTPKIVGGYNYAFEKKVGIFSKWSTAPILRSANNYLSYIGKIVFLEGTVQDVWSDSSFWHISSSWFTISIRKEEYYYFFNGYDLNNLKGKTVRFYGELWEYNGEPEILLRSPNEIVIL